MNIILALLISFLHGLLLYSCLSILLISNNIKVIFFILCIALTTKISYTIYGRCIITKYEENKYFHPLFSYLSEPLLYGLTNKRREEIIINIALLFTINKLLILIILKYYNIILR